MEDQFFGVAKNLSVRTTEPIFYLIFVIVIVIVIVIVHISNVCLLFCPKLQDKHSKSPMTVTMTMNRKGKIKDPLISLLFAPTVPEIH